MSGIKKRRAARRQGGGLVRIDVACNDPDNGNFAGRAAMIQIHDMLELTGRYWDRAPRFVETETGFRLSGKNWPCDDALEYVGNWCWNGYWLKVDVAADFLIWLRGRGLYSADCGWSEIFHWWKGEFEPPEAGLFLQFQLLKAQREARG